MYVVDIYYLLYSYHCNSLIFYASFAEQMPGNTTVGSTLLDEELRRILLEREQECMKLKAMNTTLPPGKVFFMF